MKLTRFLQLLGYGFNRGYGLFDRLKRNGLEETIDYYIRYSLHTKSIYLTAEGMAMVYHIIKKSRCKER